MQCQPDRVPKDAVRISLSPTARCGSLWQWTETTKRHPVQTQMSTNAQSKTESVATPLKCFCASGWMSATFNQRTEINLWTGKENIKLLFTGYVMQARSRENVSVQWLAGELYVKLLKMWFQIYYFSSVLNKLRYIRKNLRSSWEEKKHP